MVTESSFRPVRETLVEEKKEIKVAIHPEYPNQTITIGESLTEKGKMELYELLKENLDVFSWKPSYKTRVPMSIAEHQLNVIEGCPPVRQKKRGQALDITKAINEEVSKLVEAGIMREVHYHSWVSKSSPNDLVIKSCIEQEILSDIEETFRTLKTINMQLNPKKCTFGVEEGMFLGHIVNTKGIKACPRKRMPCNQCSLVGRKRIAANVNLLRQRRIAEPENQLQLHGKDSVGIIECDNKIEEILPSSLDVELREHDISYRPRTSIKGQILADFIVERLGEDPLATGTVVEEKAQNHGLCSRMDLPAKKDPELVKYSKAQKKHNSPTTYSSNLTHPT
ncbi:hypothetical protein Tco_1563054 [Tanacetum coccineum]